MSQYVYPMSWCDGCQELKRILEHGFRGWTFTIGGRSYCPKHEVPIEQDPIR